ncbi:MAG: hypothetical protein AB7K64_03690 [Variibacter sp.]
MRAGAGRRRPQGSAHRGPVWRGLHPGLDRGWQGFHCPATFLVLAATEKLTQENPKITRAVLAAMEDANAFIKANPKEAAEIYIKSENSKMQVDFVTKVIKTIFGAGFRGITQTHQYGI